MTILSVIPETEKRFAAREQERQANLAHIERGNILAIAANTPELLAQRLQRLHAEPERVQSLTREGLKFDAIGPGQTSSSFPRGLERVLDSNDLLGMRFFEQGLRVARAVGRVRSAASTPVISASARAFWCRRGCCSPTITCCPAQWRLAIR